MSKNIIYDCISTRINSFFMLLKLLLVCDVSWNATIIENFYIRTEYLIYYYHRITCGISYYDLLAHERPAPQLLRERCRGVEARSVNSCCCWIFSGVKKTFRPKGMDVLSRCILSSRGPIWICVFFVTNKNQEGKALIFVAKSGSIIFFHFFFLAETIQLSFPLKQLGIRLKAPGCTDTPWENRLEAARLVRWCEFPSALSLLYCKLLHLFRQKLRSIQFSKRHRGMHKSTFESHMIFMPSVVWDLWKVKQVPKIP